ncbi:hypothetical protein HNQ57_001910 [Zhongshania antarctica]|uniref:Uncharacterized protein n=1 Tax=Zhongshania antarctica TaxID=641702 RepID=A0A840R5D6_9GAMM|nr:hypothetical protein [Zhongshania antarctica]
MLSLKPLAAFAEIVSNNHILFIKKATPFARVAFLYCTERCPAYAYAIVRARHLHLSST